MPYARDERLARPWALPGTPGLMHRIGGLEKQDITGNVNYEPANHEHMVRLRAAKIAGIARELPPQQVDGPRERAIAGAELGRHVRRLRHGRAGRRAPQGARSPMPICAISIRFRSISGELFKRYEKVLIPELNLGQLRLLIRGMFLIDAKGLNKVQGKPFTVAEVTAADRRDAEMKIPHSRVAHRRWQARIPNPQIANLQIPNLRFQIPHHNLKSQISNLKSHNPHPLQPT